MLVELTTIDKPMPLKATDYMFLVEAISHKFRKNNKERIQDTEIYSVCCEELLKAIKVFNPLICPDPTRFIYRAMRNGVIEYQRYNKRKKRFAQFEHLPEELWGNIPEEKVFSASSLPPDILKKLLDNVDECDLKLLTDLYVDNKKMSVIGEEMGVSRVTIYNRTKKIIEKIRQSHPEIIEIYGGIINVD